MTRLTHSRKHARACLSPARVRLSPLQAADPLRTLDSIEYFVMVTQASLMLRGLGEMLQQSRNLAVAWRPYARQALAEKGRLAAVEAEIAAWTATPAAK